MGLLFFSPPCFSKLSLFSRRKTLQLFRYTSEKSAFASNQIYKLTCEAFLCSACRPNNKFWSTCRMSMLPLSRVLAVSSFAAELLLRVNPELVYEPARSHQVCRPIDGDTSSQGDVRTGFGGNIVRGESFDSFLWREACLPLPNKHKKRRSQKLPDRLRIPNRFQI